MVTVYQKIIKESDKRTKTYKASYDAVTGKGGCGNRKRLQLDDLGTLYLPTPMFSNAFVKKLKRAKSIAALAEQNCCSIADTMDILIRIRIKHDFQFWAYQFVVIKSKDGGGNIPFLLNYAQIKTLSVLEDMRLHNTPIRMIILKARQWGGSTLVQIYMGWIQLVHKEGFYSAIVAHVSSAALKIREMYAKFIRQYPPQLLNCATDEPLTFKPYGASHTDVTIGQCGVQVRDNVISIGTMQSPDNIRGGDIALAHFSEVGLWRETDGKSPSDVIRSVSSSILYAPLTMDVMESTADGENTLFHKEWLSAKKGLSTRRAVFVGWYEIPQYTLPFKTAEDKRAFAERLYNQRKNTEQPNIREESGAYLWWLWNRGATLEGLNWYITKRKDYISHADMAAEFPSDDIEAFKHSGTKVFDRYHVEELRTDCRLPIVVGEVRVIAIQDVLLSIMCAL